MTEPERPMTAEETQPAIAEWPEVLEAILTRLIYRVADGRYYLDDTDEAAFREAVRQGHAILTQLRVERARRERVQGEWQE